MLLWTASAWLGLTAIILYQVVNGMAGNTHSMLAINYGLEIFPAKGRSAYLAFARIIIGLASIAATLSAGFIMRAARGFEFTLGGVTLNHYHLFFAGCALVTASCVIPLLLAKHDRANAR